MVKPELGDLFVIPTGDGRAGVGQVVGAYGAEAYYFAIFDLALPEDEAGFRAKEALSAPVLLLALSLDAKLHAGHWTVVAQEDVEPSVPLPAYREVVGSPSNVEVVDYTGQRRRKATAEEAAVLSERKVVAPVRVERAFKASLGLEPWVDAFNELRADSIVTATSMFGG